MERPSLDDLPALGGEKVSPLRFAPVETTEMYQESAVNPIFFTIGPQRS